MAVKISRLSYNGKELDPARFRIEHLPDYSLPEKDLERIHIDGRDGDVVIDKGSYKNVPRAYNISFGATGPEDFAAAVSEISKWFRCDGYGELEDSYEREFYRLAIPDGSMTVKSILNGQMGKVELDFSCVPKKYYKNAKFARRIGNANIANWKTANSYSGAKLSNPTTYDSFPLIFVEFYSEVQSSDFSTSRTISIRIQPQINPTSTYETRINVSLVNWSKFNTIRSAGGLYIDCENERIYTKSGETVTDYGDIVTFTNSSGTALSKPRFPALLGTVSTYIGVMGPASAVWITPNFWIR